MKIEVGKTYKSADGREWLVEGKLVQEPNEGYPYIVTSVDRDYNFVNEAGQIRNRRHARDYDLLPKKLKMWVNVYPDGTLVAHSSEHKAIKGENIYSATHVAVPMEEVIDE